MLYILLGIIAIGVLLASEEGKALLSWIASTAWTLVIVAGVIFVVIFGYSWFDSWSEDSKIALYSSIILFVLVITFTYLKEKFLSPVQVSWNKAVEEKAKVSKFWKTYREWGGCAIMGFVVCLFCGLISIPLLIVYAFFKN